MPQPLEMALLGAGNRGTFAYGPYALMYPNELRFVAVAELDDVKRARFAQAHGIPPERQFRSWEELLSRPQLAEAVLNCTMDRDHIASSLAALEAGYDMLLEKPMAARAEECVQIVQTAERLGRTLQICHVLRYAPFFEQLYDVVHSGRLGDIVSVNHNENLHYAHQAHSFVRGNWGNEGRSAPMILAKCCHDLDFLIWLLGENCVSLSSQGSTKIFHSGRVGPNIPDRCLDGCPIADACPYYAPRIYLGPAASMFMVNALTTDPTPEGRLRALETGPYGRCVYRCDNDVVDHQVVTMDFPSGTTVTLTMQGFSHMEGRTMRIDGTRATLLGDSARNELCIFDHHTDPDISVGHAEVLYPSRAGSGHGGGDYRILASFIRTMREGEPPLTTARVSLESHLMAFAAEEARKERTVVLMDEYRARIEQQALAGIGSRE